MTHLQSFERRQHHFSERNDSLLELLCLSRSHMLFLGLPANRQKIRKHLARGTIRVIKRSRTFHLTRRPGNGLDICRLHLVYQRVPEVVQIDVELGVALCSDVVRDRKTDELGHGVLGQRLRRRDGRAEGCEEGDEFRRVVVLTTGAGAVDERFETADLDGVAGIGPFCTELIHSSFSFSCPCLFLPWQVCFLSGRRNQIPITQTILFSSSRLRPHADPKWPL